MRSRDLLWTFKKCANFCLFLSGSQPLVVGGDPTEQSKTQYYNTSFGDPKSGACDPLSGHDPPVEKTISK